MLISIFGNWLNEIDKKKKARILIEILALCWAIWKCRNSIVCNKVGTTNFSQVFYMASNSVTTCLYILPPDQRDIMVYGCTRLLMVARDFIQRAGWRHASRFKGV